MSNLDSSVTDYIVMWTPGGLHGVAGPGRMNKTVRAYTHYVLRNNNSTD